MISLQSDKVSAEELERRIEAFLVSFRAHLLGLSASEFAAHVAAVIRAKLAPPKQPADVVKVLREEVGACTLQFDAVVSTVKHLTELDLVDVVSFYDDYIAKGGLRRRKLVSLVSAGVGVAAGDAPAEAETETETEAEETKAPEAPAPATAVAPAESPAPPPPPASSSSPAAPSPLPQAVGALVAARVGSGPPGSHAQLRDATIAALREAGVNPTAAVAAGVPTVSVSDRDSFRASGSLYPQLAALGVSTWRRKQTEKASKL